MKTNFLFLCLTILLMVSCVKKPGMEGLWLVSKVKIGEEEMTPNARWMRFHADSTQESGNGWFQHSRGSWTLDGNNQLTVNNTNGLKDNNEPFSVVLSGNKMVWTRMEEGQPVEVTLERTDELPTTTADELLGLWMLEEAQGKGNYFSPSSENKAYLFFRWDKRFVIGSENGKIHGVYNVHGHKPEVELIPYGEIERNFWKVEFEENSITLNLLNSDSIVSRKFKRIYEFQQ